MAEQERNILIIGAGLCGLTLAYKLQAAGFETKILEARKRSGGRIETITTPDGTPIEMGATWLGTKHTASTALLEELGIGITEQYLSDRAIYEPLSTSPPQLVQLPANDAPSYRIEGGSSRLIKTLEGALLPESIIYANRVTALDFTASQVEVKTSTPNRQEALYTADIVVSTLPPRLVSQTINVEPVLPADFVAIAMQTHTWMGESIKFGFSFAEPFWRSEQLSGTLVSNVGPVNEMYDHSRDAEGRFGLKGFLSGAYARLPQGERRELIIRQLKKYYGDKMDDFLSYEDRVWSQEPYTYKSSKIGLMPHQNNGNPVYRQAFQEGRFFIAGSETASQFPGYMDGAVRSANWVFEQIAS